MVDTVCSKAKTIRCAGEDRPTEVVKSRFMKLGYEHIQYVLDCIHENTTDIRNHFDTVIDWIDSIFEYTGSYVCGLDWGHLYRQYHTNAYAKDEVTKRVDELLADTQVNDKKGVFEYILGGEQDTTLLNVRVFDEKTKKTVYDQQTKDAITKGVSNCPFCAIGHSNNAKRIYKLNEMDADHVTAWSKGGSTDISNCQMLCKIHNRAKGNR